MSAPVSAPVPVPGSVSVPKPVSVLALGVLLPALSLCSCNRAKDTSVGAEAFHDAAQHDANLTDDTAVPDITAADNVPDTASHSPDTTPIDAGASDPPKPTCGPGNSDRDGADCPGGAHCACADHTDCWNCLCLATPVGGKVCASSCIDSCDKAEWVCTLMPKSETTPMAACLPAHLTLCDPCKANADCAHLAAPDARCVTRGVSGSFCGEACLSDDDCASGYHCANGFDVTGDKVKQCRPADGAECVCSGRASKLHLKTSCGGGLCGLGERGCAWGQSALTVCALPGLPSETCNGVDDDCDGSTDEGTCGDADDCTVDVCLGAAGCSHLPLPATGCHDDNPCTADSCGDALCKHVDLAAGTTCATAGVCDGAGACKCPLYNIAFTPPGGTPWLLDVAEAKGGGAIAVGRGMEGGKPVALILRRSLSGDLLWQGNAGGMPWTGLEAVAAVSGGGSWVVGWIDPSQTGQAAASQGLAVRLGAGGKVLSQAQAGGAFEDRLYGVAVTADAGALAVGRLGVDPNKHKGWILRLNAQGKVTSESKLSWMEGSSDPPVNPLHSSHLRSVALSNTGHALAFGPANITASGHDAWLVGIDPTGAVLHKALAANLKGDWQGGAVAALPAGIIAMAGSANHTSGSAAYVMSLAIGSWSAAAVLHWYQTGPNAPKAVRSAHDLAAAGQGRVVVVGASASIPHVMRVSVDSGKVDGWDKLYSGSGKRVLQAVAPTAAGNWLFAGTVDGGSAAGAAWMMQTGPDGQMGCF